MVRPFDRATAAVHPWATFQVGQGRFPAFRNTRPERRAGDWAGFLCPAGLPPIRSDCRPKIRRKKIRDRSHGSWQRVLGGGRPRPELLHATLGKTVSGLKIGADADSDDQWIDVRGYVADRAPQPRLAAVVGVRLRCRMEMPRRPKPAGHQGGSFDRSREASCAPGW